jgi:hypothetical protein
LTCSQSSHCLLLGQIEVVQADFDVVLQK